MNLSRNDPCPCGSGLRFKRCCGKIAEAALNPPLSQGTINSLVELFHEERYTELELKARALLEQHPDSGVVWKLLGTALGVQGKDAIFALKKATELSSEDVDAHNNLGNALQDLGQLDEAVDSYRRALEIKPDFASAQYNLGICLRGLGKLDEAVASYRRALEIKPDYADAYNNLGVALMDLGQFDSAVASYRRALKINPDYVEARSNILFALNYVDSHATSYCVEEARAYGRYVSKKVAARFSSWQCVDEPQRLRVGLVSGDLWKHPVCYALESLLTQIDPTRIELIAYPTFHKADEQTDRIKPYFAYWRPLIDLSDEAAARLIHADGVHVLLDLSGHTAHNRLPVFAWKPAPIHASWLGYFATTGVAEMDFLLTSEVAVPKPHQEHFSESIWYLPDIWLCFTPPGLDIKVNALPALENGYLTFGCFQRLDKVSDGVLEAWGKILSMLPKARLHLANKQLGDSGVATQFAQNLRQHGIDPERVAMRGEAASRAEYLARYAEVDVILDSFPYPGVTTTCEALWMGVPTLTLAGDTLLARQGAGVVSPAGLEDWVAASEADYVEKAISLTRDIPKLAHLRAGLRAQVLASPVYDSTRFARNFEAALWGMWRQWEGQHKHLPTNGLESWLHNTK